MTNKAIHRLQILSRTTFDDWRNVMFLFCLEKGVDDHLLSDLVATEANDTVKATLKIQQGVAAGILGRNLGVENCAKYTSNLEKFLTDIKLGLSQVRLAGIQIVKRPKRTLDKHLLAEYLVNLLPTKLKGTKDFLLNKPLLDIDMVKSYLNSKSLSLSNVNSSPELDSITIKTESALKTIVTTCENGVHNGNLCHSKANCYHLHPGKATEVYKKRQAQKKKANAVTSEDVSGVYVCVSNQQALAVVQNSALIFLNSCCSDHMFPNKRHFIEYKTIKSAYQDVVMS
ncbi:hypothetical protein PTTG_26071 [Puccinia triticina 1-1 BBBD Race 1]|uniref:Uncharacterized protein n=1 Tax=Puccinia triticina (isolate 1-1 / race 1 (BBBD)) TaxID=630390 RepID=A0A180GZP3_PUCT1|nr:hypothetical protein PTTG_26071 [Puccinia triticina 1-1 BBBD Race 1]